MREQSTVLLTKPLKTALVLSVRAHQSNQSDILLAGLLMFLDLKPEACRAAIAHAQKMTKEST